eukprot:3933600-Rhodomonas_salina.6
MAPSACGPHAVGSAGVGGYHALCGSDDGVEASGDCLQGKRQGGRGKRKRWRREGRGPTAGSGEVRLRLGAEEVRGERCARRQRERREEREERRGGESREKGRRERRGGEREGEERRGRRKLDEKKGGSRRQRGWKEGGGRREEGGGRREA